MLYSKRSFIILSISTLLLLISMTTDFPTQTISGIGEALVIQDQLQPVDILHVIAGDDYRTQYAFQLYKQGYAKMLFFTGGWCLEHGYFHGAHALQLALQAGIPQNAVAYDDSQVFSTYDEVLLLQKYLAENRPDYHSIMVVSDPFHMRRARWTYRHIFGTEFSVVMAPVPFDQTPFKQQWWTDRLSTTYVKEEYQKMIYYFFRYQLGFTWLSRFDKY
jgi:uncharacterized SAM-binding protein YcdF (DUF218 family)